MKTALKKYWRHTALAMQETLAYRVTYIVNMFSMVDLHGHLSYGRPYTRGIDLEGYQWQK